MHELENTNEFEKEIDAIIKATGEDESDSDFDPLDINSDLLDKAADNIFDFYNSSSSGGGNRLPQETAVTGTNASQVAVTAQKIPTLDEMMKKLDESMRRSAKSRSLVFNQVAPFFKKNQQPAQTMPKLSSVHGIKMQHNKRSNKHVQMKNLPKKKNRRAVIKRRLSNVIVQRRLSNFMESNEFKNTTANNVHQSNFVKTTTNTTTSATTTTTTGGGLPQNSTQGRNSIADFLKSTKKW